MPSQSSSSVLENSKDARQEAPLKAPSPIFVTLSGATKYSIEEFANISSGISVIRVPSSNSTEGTELPRNTALPRVVTDAGMITESVTIVFSNADCSITLRLEPGSNSITSTEESAKALFPINSTEAGI